MRHQQTLDNWRKRLAGDTVLTHEADPDAGFYRVRFKNQKTNVITWTPVAYFCLDGKLFGGIGPKDMSDNEVGDFWTYCCQYPIPEDVYFQFDGREKIPDEEWPRGLLGEPKRGPFANANKMDHNSGDKTVDPNPAIGGDGRELSRSDNAEPLVPPEVEHAQRIDTVISAYGDVNAKITSEEQAAISLGVKNRLAELRIAATKAGEADYKPDFIAYQAKQKRWAPIPAKADAAEKAINRQYLAFRELERQRVAKEAAEALAKQQEIDEANERATDRFIVSGDPTEVLEIDTTEVAIPVAAPPPAPTYGTRKPKEKLKKWVVIDSYPGVFMHFQQNEEVRALLKKLAQKETDAGRAVPATHVVEGLIEP